MGALSFSEMEIDALGEMMNISLGASATAMSTLLGSTVHITTPKVKILTRDQFEFKKLEPAVGVEIAYVEGLEGSNIMMFSRNDVRIIVGTLLGEELSDDEFELDEINRSAICEVMNQMMGASATALSEFLKFTVNISTPVSFEITDEESFKNKYFPEATPMVVISFILEIEGKLKSEFLNIMPEKLAKRLLEPFEISLEEAAEVQTENKESGSKAAEETAEKVIEEAAEKEKTQPDPEPASTPQPAPAPQPVPTPQPAPASQPVYTQMPAGMAAGISTDMNPAILQLLNQMQQSQVQMMQLMQDMEKREQEGKKESREPALIRPANAPGLESSGSENGEENANQEMLMKVPLEISVEIGRTKKLVKDILEFTQGSLVVLDKMAGEQADLYVNGQCVARGDIVVVEDNFGIRITDIVTRDINPESL
jgi:flagellar motor switch protein FliN/FliY